MTGSSLKAPDGYSVPSGLFDGRGQMVEVDGLDQVLLELGLEAAAAILFLTVSGQRDEAAVDRAGERAQPRRELVAVNHREADVQQRDLRMKARGDVESGHGVVGRFDL